LLDGFISQLPPFATHTAFEQQPESRHPKSGQQSPPKMPQAVHLPSLHNVKGALHFEPGQQACCSLPHPGPAASRATSPAASAVEPPPAPLDSGAATSRPSLPPVALPVLPALVPDVPPPPPAPPAEASMPSPPMPASTVPPEPPCPVQGGSPNNSSGARLMQPAIVKPKKKNPAANAERRNLAVRACRRTSNGCITPRRLLLSREPSQPATARHDERNGDVSRSD
jgi:hypothetical protein